MHGKPVWQICRKWAWYLTVTKITKLHGRDLLQMNFSGLFQRTIFIFLLSGLLVNITWAENIIDKTSRLQEEKLLVQLAVVQENPKNKPAEFTSDGCSGGLSLTWLWLAETFPDFKLSYDSEPPWQHCCVNHDKAYWQGPAKDGFNLRKQADVALKQCVLETGREKSLVLDKDSDFNKMLFDEAFEQVASQMYRTVRIGGGPCGPFPWRWGYGWPKC